MEYFVCRKWCARNITHITDDHAAHSEVIERISLKQVHEHMLPNGPKILTST